jgi:4'-phosphopantetheinyl transferase
MNVIYWILEGEGKPFSFKDLRAEEILSAHELVRWKEMRFEKRRNEFLFGRYTTKKMLSCEGLPGAGEKFASLSILNEPEGAPYLDQPASGGSLSISHRGGLAASAYLGGEDRHVGIDLEVIEQRDWSFVEDFFTEGEVESVKRMAEPYRSIWVTLMWSAKEAVLKTWRKGLRLDTRELEIQHLSQDVIASLDDQWMLIQIQAREDHYPSCWLYAMVFGEYVLTLAYTKLPGDNQKAPIQLVRVGI